MPAFSLLALKISRHTPHYSGGAFLQQPVLRQGPCADSGASRPLIPE
jgi:hypothetical protein